MVVDLLFTSTLDDPEDRSRQSCKPSHTESSDHQASDLEYRPKDYTYYCLTLTLYVVGLCILFLAAFNPSLNRSQANKEGTDSKNPVEVSEEHSSKPEGGIDNSTF